MFYLKAYMIHIVIFSVLTLGLSFVLAITCAVALGISGLKVKSWVWRGVIFLFTWTCWAIIIGCMIFLFMMDIMLPEFQRLFS